jgi:hypothetical protein
MLTKAGGPIGTQSLLDFRLAKLGARAATSSVAMTGATAQGTTSSTTPQPEQMSSQSVDARNDLFSFAPCSAMVTGQRAFGGDTTAVMQPRGIRPDIPAS